MIKMNTTGYLRKLIGRLSEAPDQPVTYELPLGEVHLPLNTLVGHPCTLQFTGSIRCRQCDRPIKKTYNQGYCFPCMRSLAECDICIVKPELCHHFTKDTCRDKAWALQHCMQPHIVYLANTSGLKVGVTRLSQVPTRWIDQGAIQALPIFQTTHRYQAGLLEVMLAEHISDKTNWRILLKAPPPAVHLLEARDHLLSNPQVEQRILDLNEQFKGEMTRLVDLQETSLNYPVLSYDFKLQALSFDRTPTIRGRLLGIKGQYLLLDQGVLNIRKFTGYEICFQSSHSHEDL